MGLHVTSKELSSMRRGAGRETCMSPAAFNRLGFTTLSTVLDKCI